MSRPLRIKYADAWYHAFNRGRRKEKIFFDVSDYHLFLNVIAATTQKFGLRIHAYALLPNHYHLLVDTPLANLSEAMRYLDGVYTQKINRKYSLEGALFRGRFKAILIEKESYLLQLVRYIHLNPSRAGLEKRLGEYPWTSHEAYLDPAQAPPWLVTKEILGQFAAPSTQASSTFHEFVKEGAPCELTYQLDQSQWPSILGSKLFKREMRNKCKKEMDFSQIPQWKDLQKMMTLEELTAVVSEVTSQSKEELLRSRRRIENCGRRALIYLARNFLHFPARQIAHYLGNLTLAAIGKQDRLAQDEILKKGGCFAIIAEVEKRFKF